MCAAIYAIPHVVEFAREGSAYPFIHGDEDFYAGAITKACTEEGPGFGEVYSYESRENPFVYPRLPFVLLAAPARIIGIESTFLLLHVLSPAVIFLLAYLVVKELGFRARTAVVAALVYVLQFHFIDVLNNAIFYDGFDGIRKSLLPIGNEIFTPFNLSRLPDPGLSRPFFLAALLLLLKIGSNDILPVKSALTGFTLAFCTFLRFYDWTVLYPLAAFMLVAAFRKKHFGAVINYVIALVCLLPFFYVYLSARIKFFHDFPETFYRNNYEYGRYFWPARMSDVVCLLVMLVTVVVLWKTPARGISIAFLATFFILMNAQVMLGYNVGAYHWSVMHIYPLATMTFVAVLPRFRSLAAACLIAHAAFTQVKMTFPTFPPGYLAQAREAVRQVERDAVLCSRISTHLMPYHRHFAFLPYSDFTSDSTQVVMEKLAIQKRLFDGETLDMKDIQEQFGRYHVKLECLDEAGRQKALEILGLDERSVRRYISFSESLPVDVGKLVEFARKRFRIDYILVGTDEEARFRGLPEDWRSPDFILYRLR